MADAATALRGKEPIRSVGSEMSACATVMRGPSSSTPEFAAIEGAPQVRPATNRCKANGDKRGLAESLQQCLLQHHMDALGAVDHLGHAQVGGQAAQRIGVLAGNSGARANKLDHVAQRD